MLGEGIAELPHLRTNQIEPPPRRNAEHFGLHFVQAYMQADLTCA